jgi:RNA polymerase sigma factor (sigma-70 family)
MSADRAPTLELVTRAQRGDGPAREALFARYQERVLMIARARLGARLRAKLESGDILQEALLEATRHLARFEMRDESSLIRWLATLVEHRITARAAALTAAKRADPGESSEGPLPGSLLDENVSHAPSPSAAFGASERAGAVQAALAELPERQRELTVVERNQALVALRPADASVGFAGTSSTTRGPAGGCPSAREI